MSKLIKITFSVVFLIVAYPRDSFSQLRTEIVNGDTLIVFKHPMANLFSEKLYINVSESNLLFRYEYEIENNSESQQSIWKLLFISNANVIDIFKSDEWSFLNSGNPTRVSFAAKDHEAEVNPGEKEGYFGFYSQNLPTIENYYMLAWEKIVLSPEQEPDSIENDSFFDISKKGTTVFPRGEPFISNREHIDTLKTYLGRSCEELNWITNKGICNSLEVKLNNVQKHLENEKPKQAANVLHAFIHEVNAQKDKALSSEAYALLFFNGEYLLKKLEEEE